MYPQRAEHHRTPGCASSRTSMRPRRTTYPLDGLVIYKYCEYCCSKLVRLTRRVCISVTVSLASLGRGACIACSQEEDEGRHRKHHGCNPARFTSPVSSRDRIEDGRTETVSTQTTIRERSFCTAWRYGQDCKYLVVVYHDFG